MSGFGQSNLYGFRRLTADATAVADDTATYPWFAALSAFTLPTGLYRCTGKIYVLSGSTSHNFRSLSGGTATYNLLGHRMGGIAATITTGLTWTGEPANVATALGWAGSAAAAPANFGIVDDIIEVTAAGTYIPQWAMSVASGAGPVVKANTFFMVEYLAPASTPSFGF